MSRKKLINSFIFSIVCLAAIFVVNFFLPRLMPGDPLTFLMGADESEFTQEDYDYYYHEMGLDKPLSEQFADYVKGLFKGKLGYSYHYGKDVGEVISQKIPRTLQIAFPAWIISVAIAYLLGTHAGYKRRGLADGIVTGGMVLIDTAPTFLVAILLLIVFAFEFKVLPLGSLNSVIVPSEPLHAFADRIKHLVLPVLTMVLVSTPKKYLLVRNAASQAMDEKYIVYARAKGVKPISIKTRHMFCNIGQPFISMAGTSFGQILAGSVVVEMIFSIDGMGMLTNRAITEMDYPMLQATLFIVASSVIVAHLITDMICIAITPRAKGELSK